MDSQQKRSSKTMAQGELAALSKLPLIVSPNFLDFIKRLVAKLIDRMGAPQEGLCESWLGYVCVLNALAHIRSMVTQTQDKIRFGGKGIDGQPKVAVFGIMNLKYIGAKRVALALHILGGTLSVIGSALSILLEERHERLSKQIAILASAGEAFLHAPSAILLSPSVYGDRGITPFVYMVTSLLLQLSGTAALIESTSSTPPGPKGMERRRPELRRMSSTVGIFIYVRLYAIMRGLGGYLQPQKYALATMTAGITMLPLGWARYLFPSLFWILMATNYKTMAKTGELVRMYGIDKAAAIQTRNMADRSRLWR